MRQERTWCSCQETGADNVAGAQRVTAPKEAGKTGMAQIRPAWLYNPLIFLFSWVPSLFANSIKIDLLQDAFLNNTLL